MVRLARGILSLTGSTPSSHEAACKLLERDYVEHHCFMKYLLEHAEQHALSDEEMAYLSGQLYAAGADTVCIIGAWRCNWKAN